MLDEAVDQGQLPVARPGGLTPHQAVDAAIAQACRDRFGDEPVDLASACFIVEVSFVPGAAVQTQADADRWNAYLAEQAAMQAVRDAAADAARAEGLKHEAAVADVPTDAQAHRLGESIALPPEHARSRAVRASDLPPRPADTDTKEHHMPDKTPDPNYSDTHEYTPDPEAARRFAQRSRDAEKALHVEAPISWPGGRKN